MVKITTIRPGITKLPMGHYRRGYNGSPIVHNRFLDVSSSSTEQVDCHRHKVMANELDGRRQKRALLEREREVVGSADLKLASQISEEILESICPAENVINDDASPYFSSGEVESTSSSNSFPRSIHVVDEDNEYDRTIDRPKGHDSPGPLSRVGASEGELLLGRFCDANLVVTRGRP